MAAFANNGGGLIIYGVAESNSGAASIESVEDWNESDEQRLRSWAYTLIQPPIHGLEFQHLTGDENDENGVVALSIPSSPDVPHFVIQKGSLRAPRRYGSHTVDMSEREIEKAYRLRFEDRRANDRALDTLLEQVMLGVDHEEGIWLVAAARPTQPRPRHSGRVVRDEVRDILTTFTYGNPFLKSGVPGMETNPNPRPGYRKWRSELRNFTARTVVDIHEDGSVALATRARDADLVQFDPTMDIHVLDAQLLPASICHLTRTTAAQFSMSGAFEISITVSSAPESPVFIRTFERGINHMRNREEIAPIYRFEAVTGVLDVKGSETDALESVRDLATDIMNQGGTQTLGNVYLEDTI